mgnify:FL=1
MGEQAIYGLAAQQVPIQSIRPLFNNADYKKQQAMINSAKLTAEITGNVQNYYQRMAEFRAQLQQKSQQESKAEFEKRKAELAVFDFNTKDPAKLQQAISDAKSLSRYFYSPFVNLPKDSYDGINDINKYLSMAETQLAKIKKGEQNSSSTNPLQNTGNNRNASYFDIEEQAPGERNFLI